MSCIWPDPWGCKLAWLSLEPVLLLLPTTEGLDRLQVPLVFAPPLPCITQIEKLATFFNAPVAALDMLEARVVLRTWGSL